VIARTPALRAREALKQDALQQLVLDELEARGHPREQARLVAAIGIACVGEALTRWLEDPDAGTLTEALDAVEDEVCALAPSPQ
jgi:hypothetical protein